MESNNAGIESPNAQTDTHRKEHSDVIEGDGRDREVVEAAANEEMLPKRIAFQKMVTGKWQEAAQRFQAKSQEGKTKDALRRAEMRERPNLYGDFDRTEIKGRLWRAANRIAAEESHPARIDLDTAEGMPERAVLSGPYGICKSSGGHWLLIRGDGVMEVPSSCVMIFPSSLRKE